MNAQLSYTEINYRALQKFATRMERATALRDGLLTARVIGEFSAGKTRLLREVLGEVVPPALYPISSLERQTRLPLEITFAATPALTLVRRAHDYETNEKTTTLKTLTEFPEREATLHFDPLQHRLRLAVPEPRLILQNGDGYSEDTGAKRLFLIDMPGWNSGDDSLAEGDASSILAGYHNLALVYVVSAVRMDGLANSERLKQFLQAFTSAAFVGEPHLLFVITHCPPAEAAKLRSRAQAQVQALWAQLGESTPLPMALFSIDFQNENDLAGANLLAYQNELAAFRDAFWASLLLPMNSHANAAPTPATTMHPWLRALHHTHTEWALTAPLAQTQALLYLARNVLQVTRHDQHYLVGMNMTKLMGLDAPAMHQRLHSAWQRQLGTVGMDALTTPLHQRIPQLDAQHPLAQWWHTYWQPHLYAALQPVADLLQAAGAALAQVSADTPDLQAYLRQAMDDLHHRATQSLQSPFTHVVSALQALPANTPPASTLATALHLGLLHVRYEDHVQSARQHLLTQP